MLAAAALLLSLTPALDLPAAAFSDIRDEGVSLAASVLESFGIASGYGDGTFRPDEKLSRAQFCKLAVMAMGLGDSVESYAAKTLFSDVKGGTWAAGYVNLAYSKGIINGYGNGVFGAGDGVTYGQAATILLRILGYGASQVGGIWPDDYVSFASRIGLDEGVELEAGDSLTRGQAALLLYNLLLAKDSSGAEYYKTLPTASSLVSDAVITSVENGAAGYRSASGDRTAKAAYGLSEDFEGLRGTLLLSSKGLVAGFVPSEYGYRDVKVAYVDSGTLKDADGVSHKMDGNISILGSRAAYSYSSYWYELLVGSAARLYFDSEGNVELIYSAAFTAPRVSSRVSGAVIASASDGVAAYLAGGEKEEAELDEAAAGYKDWIGSRGTLLLDSDGEAVGFIPDEKPGKDVKVSSVKASGITAASGEYCKVASGAQIYIGGELDNYSSRWYDIDEGDIARLFYDGDGNINLVYLQGGAYGDAAAVAETDSVKTELAAKLRISSTGYKVVKNGREADSSELARYDVGQYDAVTNTLTVSDIKITGCIEDIAYSGGEPSGLTMLGNTFEVLDCAQDTLAGFKEGDRATLLLTSDKKIAAVYSPQTVTAVMRGILKLSGSTVSVALTNGITVSGTAYSADLEELDGGLVSVSASSSGKLAVTALSSGVSGSLSLSAKTLGGYKLASGVKAYDWAGSGPAVEIDLDDITWTDAIASSYISYAGVNSAGLVDLLLFKDLTGDAYTYGMATVVTKTSTGALAENKSAYVTNLNGASSSGLTAYAITTGSFIGIAVRGDGVLAGYRSLTAVKEVPLSAFSGDGYVSAGGCLIKIADDVQAYDSETKTWMTLEEAMAKHSVFTVYYDRLPDSGGKVRIVVAE